ncbi:MAG: DMT family transporter [Magnetovibrio sp.]|nr:DMT family transporter [Magnetovibrio sp.]
MVYVWAGIAVNFIWGIAFLVPYILPDTSPVLIVFGRYFVFGLVSFCVMARVKRCVARVHWPRAMLLAFTGNVGYFLLMAWSVQLAGVPIAALIIGTLPVVIALYGNALERTVKNRHLMVPLALILFGLLTINSREFFVVKTDLAFQNLLLGVGLAVGALVLWAYYAIQNALYLKQHPDLNSVDWANAIGVACLIQVSIGLAAYLIFSENNLIARVGPDVNKLIGLSVVMGVVVSWLATHWWNLASRHISMVLLGQLIVFETISSLIYAAIADQTWPHPIVFVSAMAVVSGVVLSVRMLGKAQKS